MFSTVISAISNRLILSALFCLAVLLPTFPQKADEAAQGTPLKKCWTTPLATGEIRTLLADATAVYIASSDGNLRAVRSDDGATIWTAEMGGEFVSNILAANDDLIIVSNTSGEAEQSVVRLISKQTGVARWRSEVPFSEKYYLGGFDRNEIAAVGSTGFVLGVSLENGATAWKTDIGEVSADPSFNNGTVLAGTTAKRVYAISQPERGRVIRNFELRWKPTAVALFNDDDFVVGDERGNILAYDSKGNSDWKFKNGASISHLAQTTDGILAASHDNFLYMLTDSRGGVVWKRRLSGRIALEPVVMKGSIFAITYGDGRAYLITMDDGKIVDQIAGAEKDYTARAVAGTLGGRIIVPRRTSLELYSTSACTNKEK